MANFNIPEMEKCIKEKHGKFLNEFGPFVDKVEADHQLAVEKVIAKVNRVLTCFRDNEIIDKAVVRDSGICKKIIISKNGYHSYIEIITDGVNIVMRVASMVDSDLNGKNLKFMYSVDVEDYDWVGFSLILLDYVHDKIYSRKKSFETKIDNMFTK